VFFPGLHHRLLTVLNGLLKRQQEQLNWKSRRNYETLSQIQQKTAFLPDYDFKARYSESREASDNEDAGKAWPNANLGTSVSGIVGGVLTLAFTVFIGFAINILKRMKKNATA